MEMLDLRLREFLDAVAAAGRTPGGGSLAALVTASAAALLAKVARTSKAAWPEAGAVTAQAEALRSAEMRMREARSAARRAYLELREAEAKLDPQAADELEAKRREREARYALGA